MSFLVRSTALRTARVSLPSAAARFSTSVPTQKGPVEAGKDGVKKVDRAVSDTLVSGIEAGEKAGQKVKQAAGVKGQEAKEKAQEAKEKAKDVKEDAKSKI